MGGSGRPNREPPPRRSRAEPSGAGGAAADPADEAQPGRGTLFGDGPGGDTDDWERLRSAGAGAYGDASAPPGGPPNLAALLALLEGVRGVVPRDLERQLSTLLREVLLTLRALIDWYLERLDEGGRERRVEDIPID